MSIQRLVQRPLAGFSLAVGFSLLAAATVVLGAVPTPVAAAAAQDSGFEAAFAVFQRASAGDDAVIDQAAERFTALSRSQSGDPVLLAYAGSAASLRAKTTLLPWRKMSYAEDGLAQIDKALALLAPVHDAPLHHGTPASLETRFVAASTFLALPSMFNRHARGEKLLGEVLNHPLMAASPTPFKASVWLLAAQEAQQAKRPADARRLLQQTIASGAPQAAAARAMLKELGE